MSCTLYTVRAQVTMYIPAETAHAAEVKFEQALEECGTDASAKDVETVGQEEIETQPRE
jgi:hypothetical protein